MARLRIEGKWHSTFKDTDFHFLDLHKHPNLSKAIEKKFEVYHESPQLILVKNGIAEYDASHFDISVEELNESLKYIYG